ncbi:MAG: FAD-dependent oxidoreductase [Sphingomonadales bacterium]|nr:FAD-dependent oxidoreductase [Sphingomonadales bacterium]
MTRTIVIVGAGQAAAQAIQTLQANEFDGKIALIGDEAYVPYERPPLSKGLLAGEIELEKLFFKKPAYFAEKGIDLRLKTSVTRIERAAKRLKLDDGSTLAYDQLLLATGARVRRISIPGADLSGVHYLRGIDDVLGIRAELAPGKRLVLVGAGYIGLEVAAVANKLGTQVTVLEMMDRVMARVVAPAVSAFYDQVHRAAGVDIRLQTGVVAFEGDGRVTAVVTDKGDRVAADMVIVGIGVVPNVELAKDAGLAVDNGIVVDDCCRTSDPDIFAAGDVTNHPSALMGRNIRLESVQNAVSQGRAAALAMLGKPEPYNEVPWFWSDQYDLKLQIAGLSEPTDEAIVRGDPATRKFSVAYLRDGVFVAINTINMLKDFLPAKKLIAEKRVVDKTKLADPNVSLKEL